MEFGGQELLLTPEEAIAHKDMEKLTQALLTKKACECYLDEEWKLGRTFFPLIITQFKFSCYFWSFIFYLRKHN